MNHPDVDMLTQFALDDPLALDAATLVHITDCEQCAHEIAQIQRAVDAMLTIGGRDSLRTLVAPPRPVWDAIVTTLEGPVQQHAPSHRAVVVDDVTTDTAADEAESRRHGDGSTQPGHAPSEPPSDDDDTVATLDRRRPRAGWRLAVAAAVGLVVGAGATWAVVGGSDDDPGNQDTIATSTLDGFDGNTATGELALAETSTGPELTVDYVPDDVGTGFLQVWLLDADTGGMVALGVLDGDQGTFAVPSDLDLDQFSQVDVSLEPFDGDPAHSAVSLARGDVP